jgi:thiamine pyrophosphate-dependent acetolactate synthase large subunit-like protein
MSNDRAEAPLERPLNVALPPPSLWGSDVVAETLRLLGIPFVALNPGASFRGLHDSLVNYLGNRDPAMLLCLHEEHAVALAHGYYKASGRAIAAAVHSNVGLMHASMAVFDAWCDRVPLLLLGATGPFDAMKRRLWIDGTHTAQDQGALIRHFTKYDDQPASVPAARESILRAWQIALTPPMGPVYVNLDQTLQETRLEAPLPPLDPARYAPPKPARPDPALVAAAARTLAAAKTPVIVMGRVARGEAAWRNRVALAEALGARVVTDIKQPAAFPTDHPLHAAPPGLFPHPDALAAIKDADAVLALDWVDLGGLLRSAFGSDAIPAKVVNASVDVHAHRGWLKDHGALPPADLYFLNEPDAVVAALVEALGQAPRRAAPAARPAPVAAVSAPPAAAAIDVPEVARALAAALGNRKATLLRVPLSWGGPIWHIRAADSFLGYDGGAGIGSGPGMIVGAALALKGTGTLPVGVIGDGDFLMGVQAFWTAAHYRAPLLCVVVNNRSYFNDEIHQERVAVQRGRPVENRWIGQRIGEPEIDLAGLARAQGCRGIGPVGERATLVEILAGAIAGVERGETVVVDVRVAPGYDADTAAALVKARGG